MHTHIRLKAVNPGEKLVEIGPQKATLTQLRSASVCSSIREVSTTDPLASSARLLSVQSARLGCGTAPPAYHVAPPSSESSARSVMKKLSVQWYLVNVEHEECNRSTK